MIRSGWVIASALVVGSVAIAQPVLTPPEGNDSGAVPTGAGDVLWDQLDSPSGNGMPDQAFESLYGAYDCEAADDFVLTETEAWDITGLSFPGTQTGPGAVQFGRIRFYEDESGLPADDPIPGCNYGSVTDFIDDSGSMTYRFAPCSLGPGHYWVSQQLRQDFLVGGQHFWSNRLPPLVLNEHVWRNPGRGFAPDCTDWVTPGDCFHSGGEYVPDLLFQLRGTALGDGTGGSGGNQIPTVGPVGAGVLVLGLGLVAAYVLRRRN